MWTYRPGSRMRSLGRSKGLDTQKGSRNASVPLARHDSGYDLISKIPGSGCKNLESRGLSPKTLGSKPMIFGWESDLVYEYLDLHDLA